MKGKLLLAFGVSLLTACATHTPTSIDSENKSEDVHPKQLTSPASMKHWTLSGALGAKRAKKAWSASFTWQQDNASNYHLHLYGPLGGGNVVIDKKGNQMTFQDNQIKKTSDNPEALLYQQTGLRLPLKSFYYWTRGLAAPGPVEMMTKNDDGTVHMMKQNQYTLVYQNYEIIQGIKLPTKIHIENHEGIVKLVIKNWSF